jgi:NAD(P)-dependent dehydrogenase (short-subunit alcohol dehydrogenase family)
MPGTDLLEDRVVLVTGGGRGLGRSHCLELAAHGASVIVNDVGAQLNGETGDSSPAEEVVREIKALGVEAVADDTDVTDWDGVAALVARTVERFGRLDAVVNNAGIIRDGMITSLSERDWDKVIAVHLKGTFAVSKHACDHWRAAAKAGQTVSGRIINTTSGAGLFGNVGQTPYAAAKAGIAGLTMATGMDMARYGVTCNAISPVAATRMTSGILAESTGGWSRFDPENAAPVVAWLASEASGWLSGAVLRVDGNFVARINPWEIDTAAGARSASGERFDATELDTAMRRAYRVRPPGLSG